MKLYIKVFIVMILGVTLTGCFGGKDIAKAREAWSENERGDIFIGVTGRMSFLAEGTNFMDGVHMAVEEINTNGGINGRKISLIEKDDNGELMEGLNTAQEFSENDKISAVIGPSSSHIAIPVSTIYENAGVVMLSPVVSNTGIIKEDAKYIFQNIPSDDEIGRQMALFAYNQGYKNIAIYYANSAYGKGVANPFEDAAKEKGITIIDRITDFSNDNEFITTIRKWKALDIDAVFIANKANIGKEFILQLKAAKIDIPIIASDSLDANLIEDLGETSEGTVLASCINPQVKKPSLQKFTDSFKEKYKKESDIWGIQGYDSIKLIAYAIEKSESTSPSKIAEMLHKMREWQGLVDKISFDKEGKVVGKKVFKKIVRNGRFEYLED